LSHLDREHQRYFTRPAARLAAFYELFRESIDMRFGARRRLRSTPFLEFIRNIPLRDDGTVRFPGGAAAWAGPNGRQAEAEDEILLRVAKTRYSSGNVELSQSDNFLAAVRIDGHRSEPLDEASARLLSRHYP
jgi:hypothetical protein